MIVVDVDPRSGGLESLAQLEAEHGQIVTRTAWSGRDDGGRHYHVRSPGWPVSFRQLCLRGIDVMTRSGYTVLPPSIHPDTGLPYRWDDPTAPIVTLPASLLEVLRPTPVAVLDWPGRDRPGEGGAGEASEIEVHGEGVPAEGVSSRCAD